VTGTAITSNRALCQIKNLVKLFILSSNHDEDLKEFIKKYHLVVAAGGVVPISRGRFFILPVTIMVNLPKGKLDKGEDDRDVHCAKLRRNGVKA